MKKTSCATCYECCRIEMKLQTSSKKHVYAHIVPIRGSSPSVRLDHGYIQLPPIYAATDFVIVLAGHVSLYQITRNYQPPKRLEKITKPNVKTRVMPLSAYAN